MRNVGRLSKYAQNEMEEEIIIVENEIKSLVGSDPDVEKILKMLLSL